MSDVFEHVLVATDGSRAADAALQLARRVAGSARITALIVMHDYGLPAYVRAALRHRPDAQELREEVLAEGQRLLDEAIARAVGGCRMDRRVVLSDQAPCHEIVAAALCEGCDLIVVASSGKGGRLAGLVGGQAQAVVSLARMPVLVAR